MKLFKSRRSLRKDKKGNVIIMLSAAMPLLVGSAGLAVDTIQLSLLKRHLQRAADSAALAGAYALAQTKDHDAAARKTLAFNDAFPLSTAAVTKPTTGTHAGRAVRIALTARRSLPFWSFFSSDLPIINVQATAALVYDGSYCMVALDDTDATGITFDGNAVVDLGCGIISNTTGAEAVSAEGAAKVTASPIAAQGGVPSSSVYKQPTLLLPYSLPQTDPFENVPDPPPLPIAPQTACKPKLTDSTPLSDITSGSCFEGMDVNKTLVFPPNGVYYFTENISLNASANITALESTFVITSKTPTTDPAFPTLDIDGNAVLKITAPKTGDYAGIIVYYDPRAPISDPHFINGNSSPNLEGAFYFPSQDLTFNGNSSVATSCIQLVARRLKFAGNTTITNKCDKDGGAKSFDAKWVRLVA